VIIVDANVLVYRIVQGPETAQAQRLEARDPEWRVPGLWRYEFTKVWMMVRAGMINRQEAVDALDRAHRRMSGNEMTVPQADALDAALQYNVSAYDAQYVALARASGVVCVTADRPLLQKTPGITVPLSNFDQYLPPPAAAP
jgi:predicted nucleic acid-binding protein